MVNQKVALVALSGTESLNGQRNGLTVYNETEPLGLLYIAAVAMKTGSETRVFHPYQDNNPDDARILAELIRYSPDIVGFSSLTNNFPRSIILAEEIKKYLPEVNIIFGGDHISANPTELITSPVIDIGVIGEGEDTFKEILEGKPLGQIDGIVYHEDESIKMTNPRKRRKDRANLPFPFRDAEILRKSKIGALMYPRPSMQTGAASLLFQFGCPFGCTYCNATAMYGSEVTGTKADNIVSEIKFLKEKFGINTAFLTDLTFNLNYLQSEDLCSRLALADLGVNWYALIRPTNKGNQAFIRESTLEAMAAAGCTKIGFGIESWEPSAMHDYQRPTSLEYDYDVLRKMDALGIISKVFIILGHPDETFEYHEQIVASLKWLVPDEVRISFLTPFPGTELWKSIDPSHILTKDYSDYTTFNPVISMKHMSPEMLVMQRRHILREYYSSAEFTAHVEGKIKDNPHLQGSFSEFSSILRNQQII